MEIALGPGKTVMMNGFMMYMSGAGIHIFSIMITFMGIMNPVKAILNVHGGERDHASSHPDSCFLCFNGSAISSSPDFAMLPTMPVVAFAGLSWLSCYQA